jgi:hypothetical protein
MLSADTCLYELFAFGDIGFRKSPANSPPESYYVPRPVITRRLTACFGSNLQ